MDRSTSMANALRVNSSITLSIFAIGGDELPPLLLCARCVTDFCRCDVSRLFEVFVQTTTDAEALVAQGKARVRELAAEFGVTAKDILVLLGGWNEFVKSASSTVEAPLARRVREHYAARPPRPITARDYGASAGPTPPAVSDDNGFGAALEKARRQSRRRAREAQARANEHRATRERDNVEDAATYVVRYRETPRDRRLGNRTPRRNPRTGSK